MRLTRRGRRDNYVVDVVDAVFSHTEGFVIRTPTHDFVVSFVMVVHMGDFMYSLYVGA